MPMEFCARSVKALLEQFIMQKSNNKCEIKSPTHIMIEHKRNARTQQQQYQQTNKNAIELKMQL